MGALEEEKQEEEEEERRGGKGKNVRKIDERGEDAEEEEEDGGKRLEGYERERGGIIRGDGEDQEEEEEEEEEEKEEVLPRAWRARPGQEWNAGSDGGRGEVEKWDGRVDGLQLVALRNSRAGRQEWAIRDTHT
ncbi:hypothetical protein E2C01_015011 [Portunus trituberculatus]|uniref:Uncharacterized protein n=1 Tax=Portunus trituberculatus TaxID=210409 RepID=A0A5B7DM03_PORTR|nr:hypothetical protein [Portunus trituberculatus]